MSGVDFIFQAIGFRILGGGDIHAPQGWLSTDVAVANDIFGCGGSLPNEGKGASAQSTGERHGQFQVGQKRAQPVFAKLSGTLFTGARGHGVLISIGAGEMYRSETVLCLREITDPAVLTGILTAVRCGSLLVGLPFFRKQESRLTPQSMLSQGRALLSLVPVNNHRHLFPFPDGFLPQVKAQNFAPTA